MTKNKHANEIAEIERLFQIVEQNLKEKKSLEVIHPIMYNLRGKLQSVQGKGVDISVFRSKLWEITGKMSVETLIQVSEELAEQENFEHIVTEEFVNDIKKSIKNIEKTGSKLADQTERIEKIEDRRKYARHKTQLHYSLETNSDTFIGKAKNMHQAGAFLLHAKNKNLASIKGANKIVMTTPYGDIVTNCRVVYQRDDGVGIKFEGMSAASKTIVEKLLAQVDASSKRKSKRNASDNAINNSNGSGSQACTLWLKADTVKLLDQLAEDRPREEIIDKALQLLNNVSKIL